MSYKTIYSALRAKYPELAELHGFTSEGYRTVHYIGTLFEVRFPNGSIKRVVFDNEKGVLIE